MSDVPTRLGTFPIGPVGDSRLSRFHTQMIEDAQQWEVDAVNLGRAYRLPPKVAAARFLAYVQSTHRTWREAMRRVGLDDVNAAMARPTPGESST